MLALVLSTRAAGVLARQNPNTDAQWEIINAYHDGRLILLAIAIVIVVMVVKQFKSR
jgi:flagellar biosynthesis component FlhA